MANTASCRPRYGIHDSILKSKLRKDQEQGLGPLVHDFRDLQQGIKDNARCRDSRLVKMISLYKCRLLKSNAKSDDLYFLQLIHQMQY